MNVPRHIDFFAKQQKTKDKKKCVCHAITHQTVAPTMFTYYNGNSVFTLPSDTNKTECTG